MKWNNTLLIFLGILLHGVVAADITLGATPAAAPTESLDKWEWFKDVAMPAGEKRIRIADLVLTPDVFDKANPDLGDLRLYDVSGRPVPYALRVRNGKPEQQEINATIINRSADSTELMLDLGERPEKHNEVLIETLGSNFRRRVQVEGGDDRMNLKPLLEDAFLMNLQGDSKPQNKISYPTSQYRYLRIHVLPDKEFPKDKPTIQTAKVIATVHVPAQEVTWDANLSRREPVRADGTWGSAWIIDLDNNRAPCTRISLDVTDEQFDRPYRLEWSTAGKRETGPTREEEPSWQPVQEISVLEDGQPMPGYNRSLARRVGDKPGPLEIRFQEVTAGRLRLTITDANNRPLDLTKARWSAPVRQLIFERKSDLAPPVRLYFGNPQAVAPGWDFAKALPAKLEPPPERCELTSLTRNPEYIPPPLPWTERWPWVVYLVLGFASLVLLAILAVLARETIKRRDVAGAAT